MSHDIVVIQPLVALIASMVILLLPRLLKLGRGDLLDRNYILGCGHACFARSALKGTVGIDRYWGKSNAGYPRLTRQ